VEKVRIVVLTGVGGTAVAERKKNNLFTLNIQNSKTYKDDMQG